MYGPKPWIGQTAGPDEHSVFGPPPGQVVRNPQRTVLLSVIAVLVCAALGAGIWLAVRSGTGDDEANRSAGPSVSATETGGADGGGPTDAATDGLTGGAGEPSDLSNTEQPTADRTIDLSDGSAATLSPAPAGFTRVQDPNGFVVDVPSGWHRSVEGPSVFYSSPGGASLLQIFRLNGPEPTPWASAREAERLASKAEGYDLIGLSPLGTGSDADALIEYLYTSPRFGPRHVVDRRFVAPGDGMYAILSAGPSDDRTAQTAVVQAARQSFCPESTCETAGN